MTDQDPPTMTHVMKALREPFPPERLGKLPRVTCGDCRDSRSRVCDRHAKARCSDCGNWISTAHMHLDYVGHADVTDRLLDVDPGWSWEPLALDPQGLPALDRNGGMWIRLTVAGVTRLGYGHAGEKHGGDAMKEIIGDCLVTGTPILTRDGWQPIETVHVGQQVLTRYGWRRVTDHWLSAEAAPVVAVLSDDGRILVATPRHRVPTDRGTVSVGMLRNGDMLYAWPGTAKAPTPKMCRGTGVPTAGFPRIQTGIGASTSWQQPRHARCSIATSTPACMALSVADGTSITVTTTQTTMSPSTSWLSLRPNTPVTITANVSLAYTGAIAAESISVLPNILGISDGVVPDARKLRVAQPVSSNRGPVQRNRLRSGTAWNAELRSRPLSRGASTVGPRVVAVLDAGNAPVWNLSVEEVHEYIANGLVVNNSLRNAAMRFGVALDLWRKETPIDDDAQTRASLHMPRPARSAEQQAPDPAVPTQSGGQPSAAFRESVVRYDSFLKEIREAETVEAARGIGSRAWTTRTDGKLNDSQYTALAREITKKIEKLEQPK